MKTIYVFLAEGFEEVEALTPVDVLRRAGLPVKTVSVTGVLTVNGAHGVPVVADMVFEEVKEGDAEMIVLPWWSARSDKSGCSRRFGQVDYDIC